ncbi:MAG: HNH endonuclease [Paraburkholderia tropica]|uniref:HNH endonuclease n=1 Tax=Paraburkholderia tropica TaxID=92647 RepID=UPI0031019821
MTASDSSDSFALMPVRLRNGGVAHAKVDRDTLDAFGGWSWQVTAHSKGYVRRTRLVSNKPRKFVTVYLHRAIMECPEGYEVDHINGDPLDNRRANLRIVLRKQNAQNISAVRGRAGHRGVESNVWGRFMARAQCNGKRVYLGVFATAEEAAAVVSAWRRENMPFSVERERVPGGV